MHYKIKAYRAEVGVVVVGYEADSLNDAMGKAESDGYSVITATTSIALRWKLAGSNFPLVLFTQELLSLLEAGLPLLEVIEALAKKERRPSPSKVYKGLVRMLREGKSLSGALASYPEVFPPLYVALVNASESTGGLPQALKRYQSYRSDVDAIRKKISSAAIYPSLLMVVGGLVVTFLLTYVVPRFSVVYEDLGDNLPLMSRVLMQWGKYFKENGSLLMSVVGAIVILMAYFLSRRETRRWMMGCFLQLPAVGERMRIFELSRFYRTLGMLLQGGIHIRKALEMTSGLLSQQQLQMGLQHASREISEGQSLSEAMQRNGLSSDVAYQLLSVGERSGNLGEMMERISRFYDDDIARWMEWFTRLFEPLLMVFIGLVIGLIVLLMYMPIFELAGSIQ